MVSASGLGVVSSAAVAVGRAGVDTDRVGRPGASDREGEHAAMRTDPVVASAAHRADRRVSFGTRVDASILNPFGTRDAKS